MTHQFPHLSLKTAVRDVEVLMWHIHWDQQNDSNADSCPGTQALARQAQHEAWWPTITVWPEATCLAAAAISARCCFCSPAVWELHLSYQPLITKCLWSLLGACTENASCAKGSGTISRSLSGAHPSVQVPWLQQQGSYWFLSFMSLCTNTQLLQNGVSKMAFLFIFTAWFHTTFPRPGLESQ